MILADIERLYNGLKDTERDLREELRHLYSPLLMDTDEDNPMKCDIPLERNAFGISTLEMPHVTGVWQHPTEGWIFFNFDDNGCPCDFDDMDTQDLIDILNELI